MTSRSFTTALISSVATSIACASAGVAIYVATTLSATPAPEPVEQPATTSPAALVDRHDCWIGEAPADVDIPGHVVVTVDGTPTYGGVRLTGQALEQHFDGIDHGLIIHGFCR